MFFSRQAGLNLLLSLTGLMSSGIVLLTIVLLEMACYRFAQRLMPELITDVRLPSQAGVNNALCAGPA